MIPIFDIRDQHTVANQAAARFVIKFYWNIGMTILIVCFCITMAELSILQNLKKCLYLVFYIKNFSASDLYYKVYSKSCVHFINATFINSLKLFMRVEQIIGFFPLNGIGNIF